jgi:hypothetical protein
MLNVIIKAKNIIELISMLKEKIEKYKINNY